MTPSTRLTSELPSPDEIAAYRERGWHVTGQVVPHDLLDSIRILVEEHQHRPAHRRLPESTGHTDWSPADGPGVRNSEFLTVQEPAFSPLTLMPLIGQIAALLAGTDEIRLFDDQAVLKPPTDDRSVVGWHTDHSYWSTCTSDRMLTAWIPFEDATIENGTLAVVEGSHLWLGTDNLRYFNVSDLDRLSALLGREVSDGDVRRLEVRKGQVEFHHARMIHASAANHTAAPRLAIAVHLQDKENAYRRAFTPDGVRIVLPDDKIARRTRDGDPDYSDPACFPVLWRAGSAD
ncbi:MAG: phytanoyl-CoA dioxygenase family protein [Candidatus Nanopelagicales bacterium]